MTETEVFKNLCILDKRNPNHGGLYYHFNPEDERSLPRPHCACQNCFFGRNRLALEILRLREEREEQNDIF